MSFEKSFFARFLYLLSSEQKKRLIIVLILLIFGTILEMIGIAVLLPLLSIFSGGNNFDFIKYFFHEKNITSEKLILYLVTIIVLLSVRLYKPFIKNLLSVISFISPLNPS